MNNQLTYEQKLANPSIPDMAYAIDVMKHNEWYCHNNDAQKDFLKRVVEILPSYIDTLSREDLITVTGKIYITIEDCALVKQLFDKSIEMQHPLISAYKIDFKELLYEEQVAYIKLVNSRGHDDFFDIAIKMGSGELGDIYKDVFYTDDINNASQKIIPNEKFNLRMLEYRPHLVLTNTLLPAETKQQLFHKALFPAKDEKKSRFNNYWEIFNFIKSQPEKTLLSDLLKMTLKAISIEEISRTRKNNLIEYVNAVGNHKGLIDETIHILKNDEAIKNGICNGLKEKIKLPNDIDIRNFSKNHLFNEYRNINVLQYLVITIPEFNSQVNKGTLLLELCKKDKNVFHVFTNSIHNRVNEFDYEVNMLDLQIQGKIHSSFINQLYTHKIVEDSLKPNTKDKVAALLFKRLYNTNISQKDIYTTLLNAISVLPYNLVTKYYKRYREALSQEKLHDIDVIINMIKLEKTTPKKENLAVLKVNKI